MKVIYVVVITLVIMFTITNASCIQSSLPRYEIIDLGTLGGKSSYVEAINNAGQVIGKSETAGGYERAFFWDRTNGMIDLGTLGGMESRASAINDAGQVIGKSETTSGYERAFLWDHANGMIDLGTLGGDVSYASAINDASQIVGISETASGDRHAFFWDSISGIVDLGTLGGDDSSAIAINSTGQVVGWSETSEIMQWKDGHIRPTSHVKHIFLWDSANGMTDLGTPGDIIGIEAFNNAGQVAGWSRSFTASDDWNFRAFLWDSTNGFRDLGTLGGNHSEAYAIDDAGQVVGESNKTGDFSNHHAFLWDSTDGMTDLGRLGDLFSWALGSRSRPHAINNTGQVVGWSARGHEFFGQGHAWLWNKAHGMMKLEDLLVHDSGWKRLISAEDINNRGQIVGYGITNSGEIHAFLMTPVPEPVRE